MTADSIEEFEPSRYNIVAGDRTPTYVLGASSPFRQASAVV